MKFIPSATTDEFSGETKEAVMNIPGGDRDEKMESMVFCCRSRSGMCHCPDLVQHRKGAGKRTVFVKWDGDQL